MNESEQPLDLQKGRCLKPYPAYKDSGVEWLGQIPAHWECRPLKFRCHINSETLGEETDPGYELQYVDISNVDSTGKILGAEELRFDNAPSRARRRVRSGDTIISTVRTYLKAIAYLDNPSNNLIVSTGFAVLRPRAALHPPFLWRVVQSEQFVQAVQAHSEGVGYPAINPGQLGRLLVWIPRLDEEREIAAFLDRATQKIDALVAKKERLIELLQEKRAALITHAVTKGLPSTSSGQVTHSVPMKDSGVEWLGQIPADWGIKPLKRVLLQGLTNGLFLKKDQYGSGVKLVNVVDLYREDFLIDPESLERVEANSSETVAYIVLPGDVFFVRSSLKLEGIGASACMVTVPEPTVFECHLVRARSNKKLMLPAFLVNYLNSVGTRQRLIAISETTTMTTIAQPKLGSMEVVVPPLLEQQAIVDFIGRESSKLNGLTAKVRDGIEKLKEYRTALISAAVTGNIDVRATLADSGQANAMSPEASAVT